MQSSAHARQNTEQCHQEYYERSSSRRHFTPMLENSGSEASSFQAQTLGNLELVVREALFPKRLCVDVRRGAFCGSKQSGVRVQIRDHVLVSGYRRGHHDVGPSTPLHSRRRDSIYNRHFSSTFSSVHPRSWRLRILMQGVCFVISRLQLKWPLFRSKDANR